MKKKHLILVLLAVGVTVVATIFIKLNVYKKAPVAKTSIKKPNIVNSVSNSVTMFPVGNGISNKQIWDTYTNIKVILPNITLGKAVQMPAFAYYPPRRRYRADSLIQWMSKMAKPNEVLVGITGQDISTTLHGQQDWGVMGLGYRPGNACISSAYRLKPHTENFWKIVIHELGHTVGLDHCPVTSCFMRDAEGGNTTGDEYEFCSKCKAILVKNGWKL